MRQQGLSGQSGGRNAAALALAAALLLSACSYIPFIGKKKTEEAAGPASSCPVAAVLKPLANTAVFAPAPERKPINVAWYGLFSDISASCSVNGDALSAVFDNIVIAERGPAVRGNDVDFDYFIALTDANQTVLGKKMLSVHVTVPDKNKRGGVTDHVEVAFNTGGRPLSELTLSIGFQLPPDVVDFYRHYRGR